jgi:uncharacterized protein YoxC
MVLRIGPVPVWVAPSELVASARAVLGWTDDAVELVAALPARVAGLLDEIDGLLRRVSRAVQDVERLVGAADQVMSEVGDVAAGAATLLVRVDTVAGGAAGVLERAGQVAGDAALVVAEAGTTAVAAGVVVRSADAVTTRADAVVGVAADVTGRSDGVVDAAAGVTARAGLVSDAASRLLALYAPMAERVAPLAGRFVEEFSENELQAAIRMVDRLPQLTHHLEADILPILATLDRVGPDVHQLLEVLQDVRLAIQGVPGFRMLRRRGEREEADGD